MKRILSILLVLLLSIFAMTSCEALFDFEIPNEDLGLPCVHEYEDVVTDPTCTAGGFTTTTCKICGDSSTSNETAAFGHKFLDGICTVCNAEDPNYVPPVNEDANLRAAYDYVHQNVKDIAKVTGASYEIIKVVTIEDNTYEIKWEVSDNRLSVEAGSADHLVKIVVPKSTSEINYTLKFTVTNEKGESLSREYAHTVPVFVVNSFDEYMAASAGDNLTISGIVVAINSKAAGNTRNHLFLADENVVGGYYSYQMDQDPVADLGIEVGMTVIVTGPAAPYSGMMEIKGGVAEIIDTNKKTVDFVDVTEDFANGDSLAKYTALPVVIKGVTVGTQELGGTSEYLYFELNGHKSYIRTYVTDFPTTLVAADKATIDGAHAEHYDWIADVYGIVVLYSNNPYLIPLSVDCFDYLQAVEKTPAEKVAAELENLKVTNKITSDTVLELGTTGNLYSDVVFSWASNSEYAVVDGGKVTITVPDTATDVVLTLTASCGEASDSKEYTINLSKSLTPITEAIAIGSAMDHNTYTEGKYLVGGIITEVYNTQYGNMYIKDAEGNTFTIYGTYDADGTNRYDAMENAPVAGDYVVILGAIGQFNGTPQIKNGWIVSKSTAVDLKDAADTGLSMEHNTYSENKYLITGEITEIKSEKYGNMYIKDADGNTIYIYGLYDATGATRYDAMATKPAVGDTITVLSVIGNYNAAAQLKNAWLVGHEVAGGGDTPKPPVVDGDNVTVNVTIADYADANSWANGTLYDTIILDGNITVTASGTPVGDYGLNTGKYYTNGENWRIYQTETPAVTIIAADGVTIVSVKITYAVKNGGCLTLNSENIDSDTVVEVNASSITFGVGNTGTATNGQAQITAIEVVYATGSDTPDTPCEHNYESSVTAPTCTDAGYTTYTCSLCGDSYKEEGEAALGHTAGAEATCTAPQLCTVCGAELAAVLDHDYVNGACSVCGLPVYEVVDPVVDTAYKFGMVQGNLGTDVYYLNGAMSGYYMDTTTDVTKAIDVYLESTDGGYYMYCYIDGAKTYINFVVSGTYVNGKYEATATTVYTYNAELQTVVVVVNDTDYVLGTNSSKTFTTVGPVKTSYSPFYNQFYAPVELTHEHNYVDGVCSCGLLAGGDYNVPQALVQPGDYTTAFAGGSDLNWFSITARQGGYWTVSSTYASAWLKIGTDINAAAQNDGKGSLSVYVPAGVTCYIGVSDWNGAAMEIPFTVSFEAFTSEPVDHLVGAWQGDIASAAFSGSYTLVIDENALGTVTIDGGYFTDSFTISTLLLKENQLTIIATSEWGNNPPVTVFTYDAESDTLVAASGTLERTELNPDVPNPDVTYDTVLYPGNNTIYGSADEITADCIERTVVISEAGDYSFKADAKVTLYDVEGNELTAVNYIYTLEAGTYTVKVSALGLYGYEADQAISITVDKKVTETGEPDGSESNPYTIDSLPTDITFTSDAKSMVYYLYTATEAGYIVITYTEDGDSWANIFNVADGQDSNSGYMTKELTFAVAAGATYRIGIGTWNTVGEVTINVSFITELPECEHVYEENTWYHPELVAATCTTGGVAVYECTLCDHYYTVETPADPEAHAFWGDEEIITEANCATQTNGLKKVACANGCGATEEQEIYYTTAHVWDVQKDEQPTCTTDGGYYAVCTLCNEVESYDYPASGHYNWYLTCGETGVCMAENCGVEFTLEHAGDPATCTTAMYCYNCWSYVGEPLGHSYVDGVCSVCGEAEVTECAHNTTSISSADATCTEDGYYTVTCDDCGEVVYSETTPAAGHSYVDGVCSVCGEAEATECAHNSTSISSADATCTTDGYYTVTCDDCGEVVYSETTPATNHSSTSISSADATCTEDGYYTVTCDDCGEVVYSETTPATNHSSTSISSADATCTEDGYYTVTCDDCGEVVYSETTPATGHTAGDAATCTTAQTCTVCSAKLVAALGHSYVEYVCANCGQDDPDHYFEMSITDALAAADGKKVSVSGTVIKINTAWSDSYGNISVTIADDDGNQLYIYRLATNVALNDIIKVTGAVGSYNGAKQIAAGATAEIVGTHTCTNYSEATCQALAACVVCGATTGELADHDYVDGVCSVCGHTEGAAEPVTETLAIAASTGALASDSLSISWTFDNFTVTGEKGSSTTAIRTTDTDHFRVYANSNFIISSNNGQKMTKVVITVTASKYASPLVSALTTAGATATADGTTVTIEIPDGVDVLNFTAAAQTRISTIVITYTA